MLNYYIVAGLVVAAAAFGFIVGNRSARGEGAAALALVKSELDAAKAAASKVVAKLP